MAAELIRLKSELNRLHSIKRQLIYIKKVDCDNELYQKEINILEIQLVQLQNSQNYILNFELSEIYLDADFKLKIISEKILHYDNFKLYFSFQKLLNLKILSEKFETFEKKNILSQNLSDFKNKIILLKKNEKINEKVKIIDKTISTLTTDMDIYILKKEKIVATISTITEKNTQMNELMENIILINDELIFLNTYQKCVDKKTGISQKILADLCDIMTVECNKILSEIAEFEILILMETKILRIYTIEQNVKIPASMASGYQKFIMDMILRIVLTTCLAKSNNISNPNILILDEGFGCLDKKNFVEVAKVLKTLKNKFKSILIITHIDELKSYADQIIDITRTQNESKLISGGGTNGDFEPLQMLKMDLVEELSVKSKELEVSREKINVEQTAKRVKKESDKVAKEDAAKQIKKEKIVKKQTKEDAAKQIKESKIVKKQTKEDAVKQIKESKIVKKQTKEDAVKQIKESKIVKKQTKEEEISLLQTKDTLLTNIMVSNTLIQEKILDLYTEDDKPMFKCKACNKTYISTTEKINKHVSSTTYNVKHRKYIKTIL
jgi:energy-coupling factor transporter ATP-binding protein EcfA2